MAGEIDVEKYLPFELERKLGPGVIYPLFSTGIGYSNNLVDDEGDSSSSPELGFKAGGGYQAEYRTRPYGVEYQADYTYYTDDEFDDYVEQRVITYGGNRFSSRHVADIGYQQAENNAGQQRSDPVEGIRSGSDDEWTEQKGGITYGFGQAGARGRLELSTCLTCLEYTNNDQDFRDREIIDYGGGVYWALSPKTTGMVQVVASSFDYQNAESGLETGQLDSEPDSDEYRYMVGAQWSATERLSGMARFGWLQKTFQSGERDDLNEWIWDVSASYGTPHGSSFTASTSRRSYESLPDSSGRISNDAVLVDDYNLGWSKELVLKLSASASVGYQVDHYEGEGREDESVYATIGLTRSLTRFGSISAGYRYRDRQSDIDEDEFDESGWYLTFDIGASLGFGGARAPGICPFR